MDRTLQYVGWLLLALALASWAGIFFVAGAIRDSAASSISSAQSTDAQRDRVAYQERLAALAKDTQTERAQLDGYVNLDIVSIVNTLESAGKTLRTSVTVSDAQTSDTQQLPDGATLNSVNFIVEAQGSYGSLMRLEQLFETLPLASSVDGIELQNLADPKTPWHLTAHIHVYTTATISS